MPAPLEKITIEGYKSIRSLPEFHLGKLNVLIGANGSGKTNFISIFKLINRILAENLQVFVSQSGGADNFLYFGKKTSDQIGLTLSFGQNTYRCTLLPTIEDGLVFGDEEVWFREPQSNRLHKHSLGSGQKETGLHAMSQAAQKPTSADDVIQAMASWKVYHFHDTSPSARLKQTVDINANQILKSDASNLAAFLYLLQTTEPAYYQHIVATIRLVAPFFQDFSLRPNPFNPDTILLRWREKGSQADFSAATLSDGTLRFACLATLLMQPNLPSTLLIDEPELGLHPYAINLLAALLRSASEKTQVIVSTQSVTLVNQFGPEDIIVVDRQDEQSTFTRFAQADLADWLEEYGMGDLWEKNILGGRPR